MDRMIYVAMTGAKHTLEQQAVVANNLANVSTTGYRAAASAFRAVPVEGEAGKTTPLTPPSVTAPDAAIVETSPDKFFQSGMPLVCPTKI